MIVFFSTLSTHPSPSQALESFSYFSLSISITDYLTSEHGVDDVEAGTLHGLWGTMIVALGVVGGGLIDAVGVRSSLLASAAATAVARATLAMTRSRWIAVAALLGPAALGGALGVPVLTIAVKQTSTERARSLAFSLFYVAMNVSALVAGLTRDLALARGAGERVGGWLLCAAPTPPSFPLSHPTLAHTHTHTHTHQPGHLFTGLRFYMWLGVPIALIEVVLVAVCLPSTTAAAAPAAATTDTAAPPHPPTIDRRPSTATSLDGIAVSPPGSPRGGGGLTRWLPAPIARAAAAATSSLSAVAGPELYKFLAVSLLTVNLKQIFRHLDATLPKFVTRSFGCSAPAGTIYALNPLLITIAVPIAGAALAHWAPFDAVHRGGWASAAAPIAIAVSPTLAGTAAFVVILSIGEAVWSPRFYDCSMQVAPEGREGVFSALSTAPLFLAKLPTGALSGWLLTRYCPGNGVCPAPGSGVPPPPPGACDGRQLWGWIAAITLTSPAALCVLGRWLRPGVVGCGSGGAPYQRVTSVDGSA